MVSALLRVIFLPLRLPPPKKTKDEESQRKK